MNRNYFIVIAFIAIACLFLIFFSLWREIESPGVKEPVIPPPSAPYHSYISGVGIVEAKSENISITPSVNRIADKVLVQLGQKVNKGEPLLYLYNNDLKAELAVQLDAYKIAAAKRNKLQELPRQEDLIIAIATVNSSKAEFDLAKNQYEMVNKLADPRAISGEEKMRRQFNFKQAEAKWKQAKANLDKIKAGTWKPDLDIANLEVQQALNNIKRIKSEIERTIITAPINGTILQLKIHEGELASPDSFRMPIMIIGDIEEMYLRVSINQLDIPYFNSEAPAVAFLQGDAQVEYPLEFVRVEPYLVNKQNLTNEITEKVDTRVLQIIYRIKKQDPHLYVGQQMDVFIESQSS